MAENVLTTIDLPLDLHRRIKGYAGTHGNTMKDLIVLGLYNFMDRIENEKEIENNGSDII
jgi:hypothetical protein